MATTWLTVSKSGPEKFSENVLSKAPNLELIEKFFIENWVFGLSAESRALKMCFTGRDENVSLTSTESTVDH